MHFGQWQDITEMKGWVLITCLSIVMHWAWAEAGCGYVHMYVRKGTQRNVGAPMFPHHRIAENPLAFFFLINSKRSCSLSDLTIAAFSF